MIITQKYVLFWFWFIWIGKSIGSMCDLIRISCDRARNIHINMKKKWIDRHKNWPRTTTWPARIIIPLRRLFLCHFFELFTYTFQSQLSTYMYIRILIPRKRSRINDALYCSSSVVFEIRIFINLTFICFVDFDF